MKKTIKTAITMLLAIIMACGSMTAFAATPADIEWEFDPACVEIYSYAGEIALGAGKTKVSPKGDNNFVYCTFEVEEDGYYKISSEDVNVCWFGIPDWIEDGVYHNTQGYFMANDDWSKKVYYLEADEYILGIDFCENAPENFSIEPLGDVVEFIYDEAVLKNLIPGSTLNKNKSPYLIADYCIETPITLEFENGEVFTELFSTLCVFTAEELENGEYEVEIAPHDLPCTKTVTINVTAVEELIAKVEVEHVERFTDIVTYYADETRNTAKGKEDMIITYTDGSTEIIKDFTGCDSTEYGFWAESYYDYNDDGEICFIVTVAGTEFICEPCTFRDATGFENLIMYNTINKEEIASAFNVMGYYFCEIFYTESILGVFSNIGSFFSGNTSMWLYTLSDISRNTARYIEFAF